MKTIAERLFRIQGHSNVLEFVNTKTLPDALALAHYPETLLAVWWYHLPTKTFSYSTSARSHMDTDKFPEVKSLNGWVRGRVFSEKKQNYIMMYSDDFKHGRVPGDVVDDIYSKVSSKFNKPITDFVDQQGYSLLGEY